MKNDDWNKFRTKLHHDWLMNRYRTFLMARINQLRDAIRAQRPLHGNVFEQFSEWEKRKPEFELFIKSAEEALSPCQLFDEYPLNRMSKEDRKWMEKLIHLLSGERTEIRKVTSELLKRCEVISELHSLLKKVLRGENGDLLEEAGDSPFERFQTSIEEFSKLISTLPHEVQIV